LIRELAIFCGYPEDELFETSPVNDNFIRSGD
jgi:hypothetical protein